MDKIREIIKQNPNIAKIKNKVKVTWQEKFLAEVKIGKHKFLLDEEAFLGGTNKGPNPASLLLASIGGCEVATCIFWAKEIGVKIDALEITLVGSLDGRGMLGIDDVDAGYQKIKNTIKISSSSEEEKIKKLVETVEKHCPVINTILKAPEFIVTHKTNS